MPREKKGKGRQPRHRKTKPPGPLTDCKLPHDIILNILSRLPIKTLLRFRSVCKPWKTLIHSPKFISLHLSHYSYAAATTTPSLLLHSIHIPSYNNTLSLVSLPLPSSRAIVPHSFPSVFLEMDVVGTHNGVVCVSQPPWGDSISLFNPATKRWKKIWHRWWSKPDPTHHEMVSIGFGFDPITNSYKVISIVCFKRKSPFPAYVAYVEVYGSDSDYWKGIEIEGPRFYFLKTKCDVVVKGVPYWLTVMEDKYGLRNVLVWFDVHNNVFRHIQMMALDQLSVVRIVDWKGDLAVVVWPRGVDVENMTFVDVWMLEVDGGGVEWWSKKCSVGPISGMKSLVGCSRNGQIVGEDVENNLFMFDPETGRVDKFGIDGSVEHTVAVFNYMESLVSFKEELLSIEPRTEECPDKLKHLMGKLNIG